MPGFSISQKVQRKLEEKHCVSPDEIEQCFTNINGKFLFDRRENHRSNPPTQWFVAETDFGRKLKVVFIAKDDNIIIRTAYEANAEEIRIYNKYAK